VRRRRIIALLVVAVPILAIAVALWPREGATLPAKHPGVIVKVPGRKALLLTRADARQVGSGRRSLPIPGRRVVTEGSATITYKLDRDAARRQIAQTAGTGAVVMVRERAIEVLIKAPVVEQVYPNNCETAALQMLLASRGIDRGQTELQDQLRRDGPLDPETSADGEKIWGDPQYGFVGRVDGGGVAGGFGVYPKPLIELARRWVEPIDLTRRPPAAIYRRLLSGRAVLAWIGLSDGPYERWLGPRGEPVRINWGEHTVLLRGLAGELLLVNDPLTGQKVLWSKEEFEERWDLLGRRAISA